MIKWFAANNLVLNLGKVNIMKFIAKNSVHSAVHISYKEVDTRDSECRISWFTI